MDDQMLKARTTGIVGAITQNRVVLMASLSISVLLQETVYSVALLLFIILGST